MDTSCSPAFSPGQTIVGKWKRGQYKIVRPLGEGANGQVFLVARDKAFFALKMGFDAVDLQSEANALMALSSSESSFRGFLIDVDDAVTDGKLHPFYVMKYVKGVQLKEFVRRKGTQWLALVGYHLLGRLKELHDRGLVFGDLKLENVMVTGYGDVELVDFGGVTAKGKAVKQFTEVYDRGYWMAGMRTAEDSYDLFSFAVLMLRAAGGGEDCFSKQLLPQNRSLEQLEEAVGQTAACRPFASVLVKALNGKYASTGEALDEWRLLMRTMNGLPSEAPPASMRWFKIGFAASLLLLLTVLLLTRTR